MEFKFGDWQSHIQILIMSLCFIQRKSARGAKIEVEVMEEFELESCVQDDHITRVRGLREADRVALYKFFLFNG